MNLSIGGELHIGSGMIYSKPGWPSPYLLAVAFGDEMLCAKMGAYFLFPANQYEHRAKEILVAPIHRDGKIGGFVFGLRGQFIFLNLYQGHRPPSMNALVPGLLPDSIGNASPVSASFASDSSCRRNDGQYSVVVVAHITSNYFIGGYLTDYAALVPSCRTLSDS